MVKMVERPATRWEPPVVSCSSERASRSSTPLQVHRALVQVLGDLQPLRLRVKLLDARRLEDGAGLEAVPLHLAVKRGSELCQFPWLLVQTTDGPVLGEGFLGLPNQPCDWMCHSLTLPLLVRH